MANRLAHSTSPYLQQHADNPVDWYEWGPEAFEEARRRDVPLLVSTGYAACHWCHVMAHESFDDPATAEQMNRDFVCVKVDREERPDVDAVHMQATAALTGHGGWPMTTFCTPDGRIFYAGTYFPPTPHPKVPSFRQLLAAIADAWGQRREEIERSGTTIAEQLGRNSVQLPEGAAAPGEERLAHAVRVLAAGEDRERGGFGDAPKFPPSVLLEFLLRHAARTGSVHAVQMVQRTLRAMASGGLYDQVAGGFARYAVDAAWVVPHFEKMLYDNALLARVYLHAWRLTRSPQFRRVALETCEWMLAELRTPQGAFASSLDADTPVPQPDGTTRAVEGATYVWTPQQLVDVLGGEDGIWTAVLTRVTEVGTFEHGTSTLQMSRDVDGGPDTQRWARIRPLLAEARAHRPQPGRDDKVVAAWNGLAIAALAEAGALLERPDLLEAARTAADFVVRVHLEETADGWLRRVSRDGAVGEPAGVLEDHGDLAEGLLALHAATGERRWFDVARRLLDAVLEHFTAPGGGFYDVAAHRADPGLLAARGPDGGRPQDPTDGATPSGWAASAGALLTMGRLTGEARYSEAAEAALGVVDALAARDPRFVGWGLAVAEALRDGPVEVAVVGAAGDPAADALHRTALAGTAPGIVVSRGEPGTTEPALLAQRPLVDGAAAAYVCRGFVCQAPTTSVEELAAAVGARLE
ncbi:thioredoxin domain-containing protein [Kineococcus xinjiangensis]|uniref:thioredoxin domain-containing protein n=1 Tax=Kineococcus xinjiangensis TaxID=512762 RepID=UPI000CEBC6A8|nr:thioredoxin domain-containing protein [Kineococcus xinjiangensis]